MTINQKDNAILSITKLIIYTMDTYMGNDTIVTDLIYYYRTNMVSNIVDY